MTRTKSRHWITVTESDFPWEREALEFIREAFPQREPFRAWSNFEFIAEDGSINEVDLLVLTQVGFFLIEIKSRPGLLRGDQGTWVQEKDGRVASMDNPLKLANSKAKKLKSLLDQQAAARSGRKQGRHLPFLEPLIFCSAPDLKVQLSGIAATGVCLRDREARGDKPERPGILAAILRREGRGVSTRFSRVDRPVARMVSQAIEQAGIRTSRSLRQVGDYLLGELIEEGPGYQDWEASHTTLENVGRRIRIYQVRSAAGPDERETISRAALREAQLLEPLGHPGILRLHGFTQHELGPALVFGQKTRDRVDVPVFPDGMRDTEHEAGCSDRQEHSGG